MNSLIEELWYYRFHTLILVGLAVMYVWILHVYDTSLFSPRSKLVVRMRCTLSNDVKVFFVTPRPDQKITIQEFIERVESYGSFITPAHMEELRRGKKIPQGIMIASIQGNVVLAINAIGKAPYHVDTISLQDCGVRDEYTWFAITRESIIPREESSQREPSTTLV